ncbi:hypothetical protein [uncultured Roseobacter sp.]|uniref:hypothetical protein n=1 Tax=uncultured Roseobacter sp. TaxID=114847 RepID=UPI0026188CE2|nr:hypothetical protein [uncultured Roseobacter sp.]
MNDSETGKIHVHSLGNIADLMRNIFPDRASQGTLPPKNPIQGTKKRAGNPENRQGLSLCAAILTPLEIPHSRS